MLVSSANAPVASTAEHTWHTHTLPQRFRQLPSRKLNPQRFRKESRARANRSSQCLTVCAAGKLWDTGCKLVGCGSSVPEAVLSNKDLEKLVETNDEWIATRTGIRRRHILGKNETLSDHAAKATQQALDMAGIPAEEVDLIILATSSPDDLFGSACRCYFSQEGLKPHNSTGASNEGSFANIIMNGQDVFKFAVRAVPSTLQAAMKDAGVTTEQLDWLVLHQANQRILDAAAQRIGISSERVVSNLAEYGNTSAASIPLAFDEAVRGGMIKNGDTIGMAGFGAGLTWAGIIVRWQ